MSYTIKIIDNESGVAVIDRTDAKAVIGSVVIPEGIQGIYATSCGADEIAMGIYTAERVCEIGKESNPAVGLMALFAEMNKDKISGVVVDMSQFMKNKEGN